MDATALHGAAFVLAYLLMRQDRFKDALPLYESRLNFASEKTFFKEYYVLALNAFLQDCNVFKDKIICVNCEQGFGDTLMFSRTLYALSKIAKKIIFIPQSALYPLFKAHLQRDQFLNVEVADIIATKDFDFLLPLTSLPYFLKLETKEQIINLPSPLAPIKRKSNKRKKIGFFWHTNFAIEEENTRNLSLEFFLNLLLPLENVELISLQVGDFTLPKSIKNAGMHFKNWLDTYTCLKDLDCVIGIDSSPAHLSAVCGIPTLILLPPFFDWRFGTYSNPSAKFYANHVQAIVATSDNIKETLIRFLEANRQSIH